MQPRAAEDILLRQLHESYLNWLDKLRIEYQQNQIKLIHVINNLKLNKIHVLLQLYSAVDKREIQFLQEKIVEIDLLCSSNDTCLIQTRNLMDELLQSVELRKITLLIKLIDKDLREQKQLLIICRLYSEILLLRKEKRFEPALEKMNVFLKIFEPFSKIFSNEFNIELVKNIYISGLIQKAKIHRSLAGKSFSHLDLIQLQLSKITYESALAIKFDSHILIGLGHLLTDMVEMYPLSQREELLTQALHYQERAKIEDKNNPDANHGAAIAYYKFLKLQKEKNQPLDSKKIQAAHEAFFIIERYNPNPRLYHDKGLLYLLEGEETKALLEFRRGLILDPHHILLLYERGKLYLKKGKLLLALEDLNLGFMLSIDSPEFKENFSRVILEVKHQLSILEEKEDKTECKSSIHESSISDIYTIAIKNEYCIALRELATYAKNQDSIKVFISYAWGISEHERWVREIGDELSLAGFHMLYDHRESRKGAHLADFIDKMITQADYIIVVGSQNYLRKYSYRTKTPDEPEHVVAAEAALATYMVNFNRIKSEKIIPLLIEGPADKAFPPALLPKLPVDFWRQDRYLEMFRLISTMYKIPYDEERFVTITRKFVEKQQAIIKMNARELGRMYRLHLRETVNHTIFGRREINSKECGQIPVPVSLISRL